LGGLRRGGAVGAGDIFAHGVGVVIGGEVMAILIMLYAIIAVLFFALAWMIAIHSQVEIDQLLGWFGSWSTVILACAVISLFWPIALVKVIRDYK
jgi:hypothetical protein